MCPSLKHFGLFICAIGYKYNRKAQTFFIVHVRNMFSFPNKKQKKTFIYEKSRLHTEHRIETKLRYYRTSIDPIPAVDIWFYLPTCLPRHHCYWTSVSFTQVSLSQSCTASSCHTGYFDIWGKRWAESRHYSTVKMLIACFFYSWFIAKWWYYSNSRQYYKLAGHPEPLWASEGQSQCNCTEFYFHLD